MLPGRWFMGEEALSFLIPLPNMTSSTFCKRLSWRKAGASYDKAQRSVREILTAIPRWKTPAVFFFFWVSKLNKTEVTFVLRRIKVYFPTSILGGRIFPSVLFLERWTCQRSILADLILPYFFFSCRCQKCACVKEVGWDPVRSRPLSVSQHACRSTCTIKQGHQMIHAAHKHHFFLLSNVSESHRQDFSCRPFHPRLSLLFYNSKSCLETVKSGH